MTLDELRALEQAARPAPWRWEPRRRQIEAYERPRWDGCDPIVETDSGVYGPREPEAALIVAARNELPKLLDMLTRLRAVAVAAEAHDHARRTLMGPLTYGARDVAVRNEEECAATLRAALAALTPEDLGR